MGRAWRVNGVIFAMLAASLAVDYTAALVLAAAAAPICMLLSVWRDGLHKPFHFAEAACVSIGAALGPLSWLGPVAVVLFRTWGLASLTTARQGLYRRSYEK